MANKKDTLLNAFFVAAIGLLCFALSAWIGQINFSRHAGAIQAPTTLSSSSGPQKIQPDQTTSSIVKVVPPESKTNSQESTKKQQASPVLPKPQPVLTPLPSLASEEATTLPLTTSHKDNQKIVLDVAAQKFYCYQTGQIVRSGPMSSGTSRDEEGRPRDIYDLKYKVSGHDKDAYSTQYATPMPYCLWLANVPGNKAGRGALAIHYGQLPGYPASHGCFRLGFTDAKWVFNWAKVGTPVYVINAKRP